MKNLLLFSTILLFSCSMERKIDRAYVQCEDTELMNTIDSYYRIKENWDNGHNNKSELDSVLFILKNKLK